MGKLDELRKVVGQMFENATEKEQIEQSVKINNCIDEVEKEQKELIDKDAELIKSYKELVKHTSFKDAPKGVETQPSAKEPLSLEASLKDFLAKQKES